jgi:hypothetical protein
MPRRPYSTPWMEPWGRLTSEQQVQTLPLNGRNISGLVMLQPGLAQDTGSMGWMGPRWISNDATIAPIVSKTGTNRFHGSAVEFETELHQYRFGDLEFSNIFNHATFATRQNSIRRSDSILR